MKPNGGFHEPCNRNADFPVGEPRRLENRVTKLSRFVGPMRAQKRVEALHEPGLSERGFHGCSRVCERAAGPSVRPALYRSSSWSRCVRKANGASA